MASGLTGSTFLILLISYKMAQVPIYSRFCRGFIQYYILTGSPLFDLDIPSDGL